jgi:hypothetical protein
MTQQVSKESVDIVKEKLKLLAQAMPECFVEGKLDLERLERTLGKKLETGEDKYSFNWAGRNDTLHV